ncbi:MAG TPA: 8-amino-7-oxononanoate synthase [Burkholderiales bacterium]|nr:8-amino-7-oxononanoate synthase [Burkholderiales bacterium]
MREFSAELAALESQGLQRSRRVTDCARGARIWVDGREYLSFCSNDYLGLAADPRVVAALCEGAQRDGAGAGASHLVSGHHRAHEELECRLAAFVGLPRALLFSSGYLANLALVTTLTERSSEIFADKLNHASLNDAMLLSRARFTRYPHCDVAVLGDKLARSEAAEKLVVTDAVFSMDGDIAPLDAILELCERFDAMLIVDDAHGFGVLGREGRGVLAYFGLASPRIAYMGTLGKAAGVSGAFVAGSVELIEMLIQRSRSYIYTTASPPALAWALMKSLELIEAESWRRQRIDALAGKLARDLRPRRWQLAHSQTPIQPLVIGSNREAMAASDALALEGILVPAIRPPTVPAGTARLRISLSAAHAEEDVDRMVDALRRAEQASV